MLDCQPVFIVGHPRSGTSLLAAILDRHSQVAIPPETSYFFQKAPRHERQKWRKILGRKDHLDMWRSLPGYLKEISGSEKEVLARFRSMPPDAGHLLAAIIGSYAASKGKSRWGEKSPWHLRHVDTIFRYFPRASVIWIVRDGRGCVESCAKAEFLRRSRLWYAMTWNYASRLSRRFKRKYSDRLLLVRYEEIVAEPEVAVKKIDQFLGLEFETQQLSNLSPSGTFAIASEPWKVLVNKQIDPSRAFDWRKTVNPAQKLQYNVAMHRELSQNNYSEVGRVGSMGDILKANLQVCGYKILASIILRYKSFTGKM